MKKLALALVAALPLFFCACNGDDEEPEVETNTYELPVMLWGGSQSSILANIPGSLNLTMDQSQSDESRMMFTTVGTPEFYPWYIYMFDNNELVASSMVVSLDDDDEFTKFIEKHYSVLEGTDYETDFNVVYADAKSLKDASVIVTVEPDFDDNNEIAIWQPVTHTKSIGSLLNNDVMMRMREAKKMMK